MQLSYFNVNGKFGRGAYGRPDYPELSDLIAEMDRLGVHQSVACHTHARDTNSTQGNKATLEAVAALPAADGRILPSLSAAPAMSAGDGETDFLIDCLRAGKSAVIELFPATNRYRLIEIRRILELVEPFRPVIMTDVTELNMVTDIEDLVALAKRFGNMTFVLRQCMWGNFSRVYDAMGRAENICVDLSWLHMRHAISLVTSTFGPGRLLFGLGPKSHAGAAIGAIAYSNETHELNQRVASQNFLNLLPNGALKDKFVSNYKIIGNKVQNSFWNLYLNGEGVKDALVIDAHGHTGTMNCGWYLKDSAEADQIINLGEEFKQFNYDMFITSSGSALFGDPIEGNRYVESLAAGRPGFKGWLVFNPYYAEDFTEEVLDGFFSRGYFVGFKFLPSYIRVSIDDKRWAPAFEYANQHRLPMLVHTWDDSYNPPMRLAEVAANYPNAKILFAHTGGGERGRRECEAIAQDPRFGNCYFEYCGSFCNRVEWPDTLKLIDHTRVIFGTDATGHDIGWELGRLLSMDIEDDKLRDILGLNMQRLLKI